MDYKERVIECIHKLDAEREMIKQRLAKSTNSKLRRFDYKRLVRSQKTTIALAELLTK